MTFNSIKFAKEVVEEESDRLLENIKSEKLETFYPEFYGIINSLISDISDWKENSLLKKLIFLVKIIYTEYILLCESVKQPTFSEKRIIANLIKMDVVQKIIK